MLAASQAFNTTAAGQKKLAQGAAAAALRTMSPTPTPVGQIQTKRMMERHSSVGASSNDQRGRARPNNMMRRNSSSSMTERTFREPSPARPASSSGMPPPRQQQPPVPRLPANYTNVPPVPKKSQRRSASIDDIGMRRNNAAYQGQPQPNNSARGLSNTRVVSNPALAAAAAAKKVTAPQNAPTLSRSDSNNSVNFSYPGRARPLSPPPQKQFPDSPRQEAPSSRVPRSPVLANAISQTEALHIQRELVQASQQPVKKRKKRDGPLNEGSHFQAGTTGARPVVHPLEPGPQASSDMDDDYEYERSRNRARGTGQASHLPSSPTSPDHNQTSDSDSATDQVKARRALRASGALQKQPSVVREDWEGEQEDIPSSPMQPSPQPRIGSRRRQPQTTSTPRGAETSATSSRMGQDQRESVTTPQSLTAPQERKPSLSPSRSARFSNRLSSDITQGQKHNPPPRSVSPRKPALKHAPSPQGLSVDRARDSSQSPSENTDASYDRKPRAKKSAHVSFDSQPAVVGIAAEPDPQLIAESPVVASPQYREQPRKWYALTTKKPRREFSDDSDDEDTMAPRPQLPVFGSVRNRRNEQDSSSNQPTVSPSSSSSSSDSSGTTPTTMNTSVSSDHAIGGLLSRDQDQRKAANMAPRSQVWSAEVQQPKKAVEDSRLRSSDRQSPPPVVTQQRTGFVDSGKANGGLPSIAVQPATPGVEEMSKPNDQWLVEVPGGFPSIYAAATTQPAQTQSVQTPSIYATAPNDTSPQQYVNHYQQERSERMGSIQEEESDHDSVYSDAAEEMSDGDGFGSIAAIVHSPVASPPAQSPEYESPAPAAPQRNVERESDRGDDAWQNAGARWKGLAESAKRTSLQPSAPIVERSSQQSVPTYAVERQVYSPPTSTESSPSTPYENLAYHAVTTESDYEEHQPERQLRQQPRQQSTQQPTQQPTFKKSMRATTPEITASNTLQNSKLSGSGDFAPKTMRNSMRNSGTVAPRDDAPRAIRSSMRDAGADASREDAPRPMRSSMRDAGTSGVNSSREDGPKTMRSSLREAPVSTRQDGLKPLRGSMREPATGTRERSPQAPRAAIPARSSSGASAAALLAAKNPPTTRATLQKKNLQTASAPRTALPPVHNDSDSESSFKKRRRAKASANDTGRYSMRRSMREDASPPPANVNRRAIRSLSPVQRRPFSPPNDQPAMRSTMRGSVGSTDAPAFRSQDTAQRSSSLFGRKKDARSDARSPTRLTSLRIGSTSRIADSDDDRSSRPKAFKSRFQSASDDEGDLRPVRGIPGKTKDDDSTDLEDSSDEEKPKKGSLLKKLSLTTQTPPGAAVERPASPTSPDAKKKRSFFGRLRKNKDETADGEEGEEGENLTNGHEEPAKNKKKQKQSANSAALGFSTDAEKEALIEQTRRKLEAAKDEQVMPQEPTPQPVTTQAAPEAETGQRRMVLERHKSDSWPLVPKITPDDERPYTADGEVTRPNLQRNSSSGTPSSPGDSSLGKSGKKKRFPLLRKAFGLKD